MSTIAPPQDSAPARRSAEPEFSGQSSSRALKNHVATGVMWGAFLIALIPLVWILLTVLIKGGNLLLESQWWTNSQDGVTARREGGGAVHAIQGTLMLAGVTTLISVPLGVLTAIYLVEYGRGKLARAVSFMVDILTGVPSIVAALFIYAFIVSIVGYQNVQMLFSSALALTILMVPVVVRSTEEMLKLVPNELREASYALGVPKWKTIVRVVLPTAFSGIVTGILLGISRVMGETAPLIILTPYTKLIATNIFHGYLATLPTMINDGRDQMGLAPNADRVWAAACTLILIVLVLNLLGRLIGRFSKVTS